MAVHILDAMSREGFEEVLAILDAESGLRAFLALHDTTAGPAFGGIRRFPYAGEKAALLDCLRLALAMSHKCALAGIAGGGGKLVVLDRPGMGLEAAYRHIGLRVERMGGRYFTGPDVGTGERELAWVTATTRYCTAPGPGGPGDLSGATAAGAFAGIAAALVALDGEEDWPRRAVVIQGLGNVGSRLARMLAERGTRVHAADLDPRRARRVSRELDIELLEPGSEYEHPCDVFAPCGMGGILHDVTIQRLACRAVAGAANNVLARTRHGDRLHRRGVLFVPDIVTSAGAVILGAAHHLEHAPPGNEEIGRRIGSAAADILRRASQEGRPPARVAVEEAERRIRDRRAGRCAAQTT